MKKVYGRHLFSIIIIMLFISPALQMKYKLIDVKALIGSEEMIDIPVFSIEQYINRKYQENFEEWFNHNVGLKPLMVRTTNQIMYSFFKTTPFKSTLIVGRNGEMYAKDFLDDYLAGYLIDPKLMEFRVYELKEMQQALAERGISLIYVITPNKASIEPGSIPKQLLNLKQSPIHNYDNLVSFFDKYHIQYVDGHQISAEVKDYKAFPKAGLHWNYYSSALVAQELVKTMNSNPGIDLAVPDIQGVEMIAPRGTNYDLAYLLNMWIPPTNYKVPNPVYQHKDSQHKVDVLFEGGSFVFEMLDNLLANKMLFKDVSFFYYFSRYFAYSEENDSMVDISRNVKEINWEDEVFEKDVIIIEMNEQYIGKIMNEGFIEELYNRGSHSVKFNLDGPFVEPMFINGEKGYLFKRGADGHATVYMQSNTLSLEPNTSYELSFYAKGYPYLNVDLYPDELPEMRIDNMGDEFDRYSFVIHTSQESIRNSTLRFFIDRLDGITSEETYIYNIRLDRI